MPLSKIIAIPNSIKFMTQAKFYPGLIVVDLTICNPAEWCKSHATVMLSMAVSTNGWNHHTYVAPRQPAG